MRAAAVAALLAATTPSAATEKPATELIASPEPVVAVRIKDATFPARVSLAFDRALVLTLATADAARLRAFPLIGKREVSGNLIPGGRALFRGNLYRVSAAGAPAVTTPTVWVDKRFDAGHDAVVSIFAIDAPAVAITQPAAPAGGSRYTIQRSGSGDAQGWVQLSGEKISVTLDLHTPYSIMNARAAAALAQAGLITRAGSVGLWSPVPGIALPYERLRPAPGATFAGLPLRNPVARITQDRANALDALAKSGNSTADEDADAIVVTARKAGRGRAPWLIIGADVLGRCSRIVLDRAAKSWLLTCNFS
jgi:hypothetical protein